MYKKNLLIVYCMLLGLVSFSQNPLHKFVDAIEVRYSTTQPIITYTLTIDTIDLSGFDVEMRIRNIADTFHVAMAAHPEYDDKYWHFIEGMKVQTNKAPGKIIREDSALWQIIADGDEVVLNYRLHLPVSPESRRPAWTPFLSTTGGLVGGIHSFLYVVGSTLAPSYLIIHVPENWQIATGLESTSDPYTFFAPTIDVLVDAPILTGVLKSWQFAIDGVPHRVVYWPLSNAASFDTGYLISSIEKLARHATDLFGRSPYREYSFLLQDGSYGALEHRNSMTLGAPSSDLAKNSIGLMNEIGHEFFHTWNLMRLRPVEYGDVDYKPAKQTRGLWWSEGLSLFYADLLFRRAGIPVEDSSPVSHLEKLISRYFGSPGNSKISPESVSLITYGSPPGSLGDYSASVHLQGEILGATLDLIVRNATNGKRNIDDVMREMFHRFSGEHGFTGMDIEKTVSDVCGCSVRQFFNDHVRGNKAIDFDRYLNMIGMKMSMEWKQVSQEGKPVADLRVYAFQNSADTLLTIGITNPLSCWGKAGLHTGDKIISVNGNLIKNVPDFRAIIGNTQIGDTVLFNILRPSSKLQISVPVGEYQRPVVHIEEIKVTTQKQLKLKDAWLRGK